MLLFNVKDYIDFGNDEDNFNTSNVTIQPAARHVASTRYDFNTSNVTIQRPTNIVQT